MKKETWWEVRQWLLNNLHSPIKAWSLKAQNWDSTTKEYLLAIVALKAAAKDNNIKERYQLIRSGIVDILNAVLGSWIVWQAYSLNAIAGSTTINPILTTEKDLSTFPTFSTNTNDETFYGNVEQFTKDELNNELTPEMISVAITELLGGMNGILKVISGISYFDCYKLQKVIKFFEYTKAISNFATANFNFKNGNIWGSSLMVISMIIDIAQTYFSLINNTKEEIIISITDEVGNKLEREVFPLVKGNLSYKNLCKLCQILEGNNWDEFRVEYSGKIKKVFIEHGKMQDWQSTLKRFYSWIKMFSPQDKIIDINWDSETEQTKLIVPNHEFESEIGHPDNTLKFTVNSDIKKGLFIKV